MPASFTKEERLSSYREIDALMKKGEMFFHYPFKVVYDNIPDESGVAKSAVIVSVPKRNFKRAVKRNLLKRRIRESYRLNKTLLCPPQGFKTNILFVYVSKDIMEFSFIEKKIKEILQQITAGKSKGKKDEQQQQNGD